MFNIQVCASPAAAILLLLSLFTWLCICRWGFRYNMKDHEVKTFLLVNLNSILYYNYIFITGPLFIDYLLCRDNGAEYGFPGTFSYCRRLSTRHICVKKKKNKKNNHRK